MRAHTHVISPRIRSPRGRELSIVFYILFASPLPTADGHANDFSRASRSRSPERSLVPLFCTVAIDPLQHDNDEASSGPGNDDSDIVNGLWIVFCVHRDTVHKIIHTRWDFGLYGYYVVGHLRKCNIFPAGYHLTYDPGAYYLDSGE